MCGSCLSSWGACGCPTSDDNITQCGCSKGIYCAVCGHYPKSMLVNEVGTERQELGFAEIQKIFPPDPRYILERVKGAIEMIEGDLGYNANEFTLDISMAPSVVIKFSKNK